MPLRDEEARQRASKITSVNARDRTTPAALQTVKAIVFDVEGCLTDGTKTWHESGECSISFSSIDGLGIWLLIKAGIKVGVISASTEFAIRRRIQALGVTEAVFGCEDKRPAFESLVEGWGLRVTDVAVMGDDLWDLEIMSLAGYSVAPKTGVPQAKDCADYVTHAQAGRGAVREVCDLILDAKMISTPTRQMLLRS